MPEVRRRADQPGAGETLRVVAKDCGVGEPHHPNAWGGVAHGLIRGWLKDKEIRVVGLQSATDAKSHAHTYRAYEKTTPDDGLGDFHTATVHQLFSKPAGLVCSECGVDSACQCGATPITRDAYDRVKRQRVEAALFQHPQKSDRVIADELGVGNATVSRARRANATVSSDTVEKRVGRDGKARKLPIPGKKVTPPHKRL